MRCCHIVKRCVGKRCQTRRTKCRFTGRIAKRGCLYRKQRICLRPKITKKGPKCTLGVDTHFITFDGKKYNEKQVGKYVVAKRKTFRVLATRRKWGTSTVISSISIIAGKKLKNSVKTVTASKYIINGKLVTLKRKGVFTTQTLMVKRISKFTTLVRSKAGNYVVLKFHNRKSIGGKRKWSQSQYLTGRVGMKRVDGATGVCANVETKKFVPKKRIVKPSTECQKSLAARVCRERRVPAKKSAKCQRIFLKTNPPCRE